MPVISDHVDGALLEKICRLDDDIYRNQWITYIYDVISRRLAAQTGNNANWFTFARWSSYTVGENLRPEPSKAFGDFVAEHPVLKLVQGPLVRAQYELRMRSDASMPRTLALGNRFVFHEIAWQMVDFLDWYEAHGDPDRDDFEEYRATIKTSEALDLFPKCDSDWLCGGIEAYFLAMREPNKDAQARLVLRGTVLLAAYEQWRLEPIVQIALDPFSNHLVTFQNTNMHRDLGEPEAVLKHRGTPWALRHRSPVLDWFSDLYGSLLTSHVMAWEGPIDGGTRSLFLGDSLPDPPDGGRAYPEALDDQTHPETLRILNVFDQSGGTRKGRRAHNWARYSDRMSFIVNLFRAEQDDQHLFAPMPEREVRILDLNLSDNHLDHLRTIGDDPVDRKVRAAHERAPDSTPRELMEQLAADSDDDATDLPAWASPDQLRLGQQFLCEHGLELASALFYASLPYSYTAARGARVLTYTAELTGGRTARRLAETGQMLLDLMVTDPDRDPLTEGTRGFAAARGVRRSHALVRGKIKHDRDARWDEDDLGVPINQEDLLGTLIVFTVVAVDALERLGVDFSTDEAKAYREAYVHYWLVVGHHLGIRYDLLRGDHLGPTDVPLDLEELRLMQSTIFRRQSEPSLDGQTLEASLLKAVSETMPPLMGGYPAAATRGLLGRERSDALGVPPAGPAKMIFEAARISTRLISPRLPGQGLAWLSRFSTKALYQRWIDEHDGAFPQWRLDAVPEWGLRARPARAHPKPAPAPKVAPKPEPEAKTEPEGTSEPEVNLSAAEAEERRAVSDGGGPDRVDQPDELGATRPDE